VPATVNAIPIGETEARALAGAIEQVSKGQPPDTTLKLVEMALSRAPQQPLVLNAAGGYMYRSGNARRARDLFEKAVAPPADGAAASLCESGAAPYPGAAPAHVP